MKARVRDNRVSIICPACRDLDVANGYTDAAAGGVAGVHEVPFGANGWSFDGNVGSPTLVPSLKLTYTITGETAPTFVCHSFVRNGRIEYLGDCTHAMAGQTVDLLEFPEAVCD
jgi:hypothetical protein